MDIQSIRRQRLAQLISERYENSQAKFINETGENQGEISALLKDKSFGEKKARKIEIECGMPKGWLDKTAFEPQNYETVSSSKMPVQSTQDTTHHRAIKEVIRLMECTDDQGKEAILVAARSAAHVRTIQLAEIEKMKRDVEAIQDVFNVHDDQFGSAQTTTKAQELSRKAPKF